MKYTKITLLLMAASLMGCQSTNNDETLVKENNTKVSSSGETRITIEGREATNTEIAKLAETTSFSPQELRKAARELGYRCEMIEKTGTRIKKRRCTTKQQRDIQDQAARKFLADTQRGGVYSDKG